MRRTDLTLIITFKFLLVSRQSKVTYFGCPIIIHENILTFQIAVKQLTFIQVKQCHRDLFADFENLLVVKHHLDRMKNLEETSLPNEFSHHVEMV
jgi:hypothetical protein